MTEQDVPLYSADPSVRFDFSVTVEQGGLRLDHFLALAIPDESRSSLSAAVRSGLILVDDQLRKCGYRLKAGESVSGSLPEPPPLEIIPEDIPLDILFEDEHLLVLAKPPGLVVHPGSGHYQGTLVNGLVYHCQTISEVGDQLRPGIVHRLDKDTSGVMVVAKTALAHRLLVDAFHDRQVEKEYLALVHGSPYEERGRIVAAIGRHRINRQKMAVTESGGRFAASNWQVLARYGHDFTLMQVGIETGRTHQIRVHLAFLGLPVAGDVLYGSGRPNRPFPRQMLHAFHLTFIHPITRKSLSFEAPLPPDFSEIVDRLARGETLGEVR